MEEFDIEIVRLLQNMARNGATVPEMLRELIRRLGPALPHKVTLVKYMKEAFALTIRQVSPIAGWDPTGAGEVQDAPLQEYVMPEIQENRPLWDTSQAASAS